MTDESATRGRQTQDHSVPAMMILLSIAALLAVIIVVLTVAQVLRDGYGHPSTIPADRRVLTEERGPLLR
jgi:hypothetical protein